MNCRHFGVCGGCSLPGVPYAEQLKRKQSQLRLVSRRSDRADRRRRHIESRFRHKVAFVFASRRGAGS